MKLVGCCVGLGVGFLAACSGRYDVGFEPMAGAAGTAAGSSSAGSGSEAAGGSALAGGNGVAGFGATMTTGSAGESPVEAPRCNYLPADVGAPAKLASSAELAQRVYRFLDQTDAPSDLTLPRTPSAAWTAALAATILDGHAADESEAPGLLRFLAGWLPVPAEKTTLASAHRWANKLVQADATLGTLLAEPTGEPHRFGIITEPDVLGAKTRIADRGAWMISSLFCNEPPAPPPNLPAFELTPPAGKTFRQHYEAGLTPPPCIACHALFDPLGDSLEHFDAQGNYRELDNGLPVDASASMISPAMSFDDFESLAPQLAQSCEVAACVSKLVFADALAAGLAPTQVTFSEAEGNQVATQFFSSDFKIRALVKAIVTSPSFLK